MSKVYKIQHVWSQLKSKTCSEIKKALEKDSNWELIKKDGARHFYEHQHRGTIVEIHVHPSNKKGYGEGMLKGILDDISWSEDEMISLKLINTAKGKKKKKN